MTRHVKVLAPTSNGGLIELFTGTLEPGVPWALWNRVRPDAGYIDLPPMFEVEYVEESADV